jgi:S-adenosylmethionine hydrolase
MRGIFEDADLLSTTVETPRLDTGGGIVDITHSIAPQDVRMASWVLNESIDAFPAGTIHLAVVDPGVGSDRTILGVRTQVDFFIAPNNGLLTHSLERYPPTEVVQITDDEYWRADVSSTFHGRDIMGPVAAHLSAGVELESFGPVFKEVEWLPLELPQMADELTGEVQYVDSFGNLITNISIQDLGELADRLGRACQIQDWSAAVAGNGVEQLSHCYADIPTGQLAALIGSSGWLEFAVAGGNAADKYSLGSGASVRVWPRKSGS